MSNESTKTPGGRDKLRILGWVLAGLNLLMAIAEIVFTKEGSGGFVRAALLVAGAVLVLGGIRLLDRRPWPGAIVASVGAALSIMMLIWAVIPVPLAIGIIVLSVSKARELSS